MGGELTHNMPYPHEKGPMDTAPYTGSELAGISVTVTRDRAPR
jgi:hypothetical protein